MKELARLPPKVSVPRPTLVSPSDAPIAPMLAETVSEAPPATLKIVEAELISKLPAAAVMVALPEKTVRALVSSTLTLPRLMVPPLLNCKAAIASLVSGLASFTWLRSKVPPLMLKAWPTVVAEVAVPTAPS